MCEICLTHPCLRGCPNEPPALIIGKCKRCREGIEIGMRYLDSNRGYYCEDCLEDMPVSELLDLAGLELETAGETEWD